MPQIRRKSNGNSKAAPERSVLPVRAACGKTSVLRLFSGKRLLFFPEGRNSAKSAVIKSNVAPAVNKIRKSAAA